MLGKDIWAFFLYSETEGSRSYSVRCEKDSLVVTNGSTSATATIIAVDGNPPKILASITSNGIDYKKISLILDRAVGKDSLQDSIQQELTMLTSGEDGHKEAEEARKGMKRDRSEVTYSAQPVLLVGTDSRIEEIVQHEAKRIGLSSESYRTD